MSDIEHVLDGVAGDLDWLEPEPVFVGGATIGLFLDALGRSQLRPTLDVDCIIPAVVTRATWWKLEESLRTRRWAPDPDGPLCRYISPSGTTVDLMSQDPSAQGFSSRWYPAVVARSERRTLVTGRAVRVPTAALLVACKLEAWESRGVGDPYGSKDLEDVVALLDGCRELEDAVARAEDDVRTAIAASIAQILGNPTYREAAIAQLPRGGDAKAQEARVHSLMQRLMAPSH